MTKGSWNKSLLTFVIPALLAGDACSGGDGPPRNASDGSSGDMAGTVPGVTAEPAKATGKIVIRASDELRFDPASIEVKPGDVVTFVVQNIGKTDHEFVLGDRAYQESWSLTGSVVWAKAWPCRAPSR